MAYPKGGLPVWFGWGRKYDASLLRDWRSAPLTYVPEQVVGAAWNADRYEVILGRDGSGELFRRAASLLLDNQFYPAEVMETVSDSRLANRPIRTGDRVLQRIRIFQFQAMPILEVLTMNEITEVVNEPRRVGFTYTTTAAHSEIGEFTPGIEWRDNGEVALIIEVVSRARPGASAASQRFTRKMQLRAHRLTINNFMTRLCGPVRPSLHVQPSRTGTPAMVSVGMLAVAMVMLVRTLWGFIQPVD